MPQPFLDIFYAYAGGLKHLFRLYLSSWKRTDFRPFFKNNREQYESAEFNFFLKDKLIDFDIKYIVFANLVD